MATNRKLSQKERTKEKADSLFLVYYQLGPNRSLEELQKFLATIGQKISLNTLKRYSSDYGWQKRVLEMNTSLKEQKEKKALEQVEEMDNRHARFAQGLFRIALAGMKGMQAQIEQSGGTLNLSVDEILRAFRTSQTGERLARGQATSRVEIWIDVVQTVVQEFGLIFMAVNEIKDKDQRQQEFIRLSDEMIRRYYSAESREKALEGEYQTREVE